MDILWSSDGSYRSVNKGQKFNTTKHDCADKGFNSSATPNKKNSAQATTNTTDRQNYSQQNKKASIGVNVIWNSDGSYRSVNNTR